MPEDKKVEDGVRIWENIIGGLRAVQKTCLGHLKELSSNSADSGAFT